MITQEAKQRAETLCDIIQELSGLDPRTDGRKWDIVSTRMMVAYVLRDEGWTFDNIGLFFGKNHSTIINYMNRMLGIHCPGWEAEWQLWEEFKKRIGK